MPNNFKEPRTAMEHIRYEVDDAGIVTLTMDWPGVSVNTMGEDYLPAMEETLQRLEKERDRISGVILTSAKETFFAGGDLKQLMGVTREQAGEIFAKTERVKAQFRRLEHLGRPVVAAITGAALGGGWELVLACHHRIVVDDNRIQLGQPEVQLGLLPGAGGITRMVRLLGLKEAFPYLMEAKLLKPADAARLGLAELASDRDQMQTKARSWIQANAAARQPWDKDGYKMPGGDPSRPSVVQMIAVAPAMVVAKTQGVFPAPKAILCAAVEGAQVDFDTATRIESRYFTQLATSQVAKNMIGTFFFQMNEIKAGGSRPAGIPVWKATKVGILGAGMMGAGIAYASAARGISCVLKDVTQEAADRGKGYSQKLTDKRVKKGAASSEWQQALLGRIVATDNPDALAGCDMVIEAVFEDVNVKAQVTQEVEPRMASGGVFASNTSTLPITQLAKASRRPANFIGLHFFSPVDKMQLVEIIRGEETSDETLARAYDYVQQIGKIPIVVRDGRGFFTTRVFGKFVAEGVGMLAEGMPAAAIENAALQAGYPVGPLAVNDEISISLAQHIAEGFRQAALGEGKTFDDAGAIAVQQRMLAEFGRKGKATGAGFYEYPLDGKKHLWPGLRAFAASGYSAFDIQEMKDRMLFAQAVDTIRCFEEGILENVRDANIGSIFGIGFPAWTGGAMQFVDQYGTRAFAKRAGELTKKYGERFAPPNLLLDKAAKDEKFASWSA
ncbi:MAG: 3-hydroxyacyl-CoA dehydrogenase NAD-binding domain-containing protein [Sterolibacterium sp.]